MADHALWTSDAAATATGGTSSARWRAEGVSIDSRTVAPGDLFIALKGPNFDGHAYVADALAAGAVAAMVDHRPEGIDDSAALLTVDDTMAGLEALGRAARSRMTARVAAITGSVGKTGTKEALRLALEPDGPTHASAGNLNNQWGAPLSLARTPADSKYAVFELGMNHAGEIAPLSRLVRPHVALITTIAPAHLEFFDSVEAIADAKAEIFEGLEPGGTAIVNRDSEHFERLRMAAERAGAGRVLSFGVDEKADARMLNLATHPACSCIAAEIDGIAVTYKVGAPGRHWAVNSLAVLAAVKALGGDMGKAVLALADLSAPSGRGRRHRIEAAFGTFELIDESYNASPVAMRAAFDVLAGAAVRGRGRRIVVLGDMLELGEDAARMHRELATDIDEAGIDLVFACGPHMAELYGALPGHLRGAHADDSEALLPDVLHAVRAGDVILVKGSLGMRMAPIVQALQTLAGNAAAANG
jgi:UDP-N-acetylmuramoyl-tripeptide--D-alanyl-D-alanine ligase